MEEDNNIVEDILYQLSFQFVKFYAFFSKKHIFWHVWDIFSVTFIKVAMLSKQDMLRGNNN